MRTDVNEARIDLADRDAPNGHTGDSVAPARLTSSTWITADWQMCPLPEEHKELPCPQERI
jgi:hypothetical protein